MPFLGVSVTLRDRRLSSGLGGLCDVGGSVTADGGALAVSDTSSPVRLSRTKVFSSASVCGALALLSLSSLSPAAECTEGMSEAGALTSVDSTALATALAIALVLPLSEARL